MKPKSLEDRFWPKVEKGRGCWVWRGSHNMEGYGVLRGPDQRPVKAHRVSWELHVAPIPEGMVICHQCDNPPCVRPSHLFIGTQAENQHDRNRKGRGNQGARNGRAKLTPQQVSTIRRRYAVGITQQVLAETYDVSQKTISFIVRREHWL